MRGNPIMYYISDHAYGKLVGIAQRHKWVKFGSVRARGLGDFLCELAQYKLIDNRPPYVIQRHNEEIAHNRAPTWSYRRERRGRLLTLTDDAVERYLRVAYKVGMIKAEPWAVGGPSRLTPYPTVAYVIEAIGLQWIIPELGEYPYGQLDGKSIPEHGGRQRSIS